MNAPEQYTEDDWNNLIRSIKKGRCVVILGPELLLSEENPKSTSQKLAEAICAEFGMTDISSPDQLFHVVETYLGSDKLGARWKLLDFISEFYHTQPVDDPEFFDQLARLPFVTYLTTTHDSFMAQALRQSGDRKPQEGYYNARQKVDDNLRKPTTANPIVYQLCGSLTDQQSLVLSENDLLYMLESLVSLEPAGSVKGVLQDKATTFLFIGFGFSQWYVRILLHTLLGSDRHEKKIDLRPSTVLEDDRFFQHPDSDQAVAYFYSQQNFEFHHYSSKKFIAELHARYLAEPVEQPAPQPEVLQRVSEKPVFLSYRRCEIDQVLALREKLEEQGIRVWMDVKDLRGGDNWEQALVGIISNQARRFVLLQTPSLVDLGGEDTSVVFQELKEAKKRDEKINPDLTSRFIVPVILQPCKGLQSVSKYNQLDLTQPDGFEKLVATLRQDA